MPFPSVQTGSSYRDRTSEFYSIAERLRKAQGNSVTPESPYNGNQNRAADRGAGASGASTNQSEFNKRASRIGLSIHQTSQKLAKLAKLAKRTSMFDDPAVEIQELTVVVKQDITALNSAITDLQQFCDQSGERNKNKQTSKHSTTVVDDLKSRLMSTTKEFKDVLTLRTENLKVHQNRRQLFSSQPAERDTAPLLPARGAVAGLSTSGTGGGVAPPWSAPSSNGAAATSAHQLFSGNSRRRAGSDAMTPSAGGGGQLQQQMVPAQDNFMASRAEALQNVESTIMELSSIFTQLATMVAQQGEMAIRIDENMDETLANIEGAQGALLKYFNRISSNRWLIMKIFFVLIVFLLIFVVFVA